MSNYKKGKTKNTRRTPQIGGKMMQWSSRFFTKKISRKIVQSSQEMFTKAVLSCLSESPVEDKNRRNGFVAVHATGTGKTLTGSIVIKNFLELDPLVEIVLVVPEKLVVNWKDEIADLGMETNTNRMKFVTHEMFKGYLISLVQDDIEDKLDKDAMNRIFIIDEAHLLIKDYFRTEEFMKLDSQDMGFQDLDDIQKKLLTLSVSSRGIVLLTATPIVHSILDLRWMYNIARGYRENIPDEDAMVPINRMNFCKKFTEVSVKYEIFKKIVDFLNSEGVQLSISRLVMLSQKTSWNPIDSMLLTGNLLSLVSGVSNVSTRRFEKESLQIRRGNELIQNVSKNYQFGVMLYNFVYMSSSMKSGNTGSTKPYIYLYLIMLAMYVVSNLLSNQLNSIKYPGEKDLFLTRVPKGEVIEQALSGTFHFYEVSEEDSQSKGFPTEVRIDRMMIDYTVEQRFLFYRFCNGQLTEKDCNLLKIPKEKREFWNKEDDLYRLRPQTLGRTDDQEYFGLKIGNLSATVKFEEIFKQVESLNVDRRRIGFYSNYSDSIVEFNKFLLEKLAKKENLDIKVLLNTIFFIEADNRKIDEYLHLLQSMCKNFDGSQIIKNLSGNFIDDFIKRSNIVDNAADLEYYSKNRGKYIELFGKRKGESLQINHLKKALKKEILSSDFNEERCIRLFNNIQRWSLYFLNKHYGVYYLGDVNEYKRIVNEFNDVSLQHTGYILLHPKWIEGITLLRVQQFHIIEPPTVYANKIQVRGRVARLGTHEDKDQTLNKVRICEWFCNDNLLTSVMTGHGGKSGSSPVKARKEDTSMSATFREIAFVGKQVLSPLSNIASILKKVVTLFKQDPREIPVFLRRKTNEATDYYANPEVSKSDIIPGSLESLVMGRSSGLESLFTKLKNFDNLKKIDVCGDNTCTFVTYDDPETHSEKKYCVTKSAKL